MAQRHRLDAQLRHAVEVVDEAIVVEQADVPAIRAGTKRQRLERVDDLVHADGEIEVVGAGAPEDEAVAIARGDAVVPVADGSIDAQQESHRHRAEVLERVHHRSRPRRASTPGIRRRATTAPAAWRSRDRLARLVAVDDVGRRTDLRDATAVEPDARVHRAAGSDSSGGDTNSTVRPSRADVVHLAEALLLKRDVADREHLVDEQDLRLEVRRHRERQPHLHAARVVLDRRVDEPLDFGEGDDLVELPCDLARAACPRIAPFTKTFSRPVSSG